MTRETINPAAGVKNSAASAAFPLLIALLMASNGSAASELLEPPVLTSRACKPSTSSWSRARNFCRSQANPQDTLMKSARARRILKARRCPVPGTVVDLHTCPTAGDPIVSPYGGVRLQLVPGETLRVRLINCLPPAVDAEHATDDPLLKSNPTNLHTHGLIVEPRRADDADDPFGDYIFVIDLPHGVKPPAPTAEMAMHHGQDHARKFDFREEAVDYLIPIDATHPAGLFWFHPHVHGISLNQVSGGLAGIITLGDINGYVCDQETGCGAGNRKPRHLIFKDVQITSDYQVRFQENPAMCATPDADGQVGGCAGAGTKAGPSKDADDGRWEFTINGQTYPDIAIPPAGDIWRMANASASASYNIGLYPFGKRYEASVISSARD